MKPDLIRPGVYVEENANGPLQGSTRDAESIYDCLKTYEVCTQTVQHCLKLGGKYSEARHLSLLIDCAEMARMGPSFMMSESPFAAEVCSLTARICEAAAASCRDLDENDPILHNCLSTCRKCAESCRNAIH